MAVAQNPAQRRDVYADAGFVDAGVRPNFPRDLIFRNNFTCALNEHEQRIERARTQTHDFSIVEELALLRKQPKWTEVKYWHALMDWTL
jgi:hypothetical protein